MDYWSIRLTIEMLVYIFVQVSKSNNKRNSWFRYLLINCLVTCAFCGALNFVAWKPPKLVFNESRWIHSKSLYQVMSVRLHTIVFSFKHIKTTKHFSFRNWREKKDNSNSFNINIIITNLEIKDWKLTLGKVKVT